MVTHTNKTIQCSSRSLSMLKDVMARMTFIWVFDIVLWIPKLIVALPGTCITYTICNLLLEGVHSLTDADTSHEQHVKQLEGEGYIALMLGKSLWVLTFWGVWWCACLSSRVVLKLVLPVCNPQKLRDDGMSTLVESSGISFMSKITLIIFEVLIRREFWCWYVNVRAICIQDSQYDAVQWSSTSSSATRPSRQNNYWSNNPIKSFVGGWLCGSSGQASFWQGSGN